MRPSPGIYVLVGRAQRLSKNLALKVIFEFENLDSSKLENKRVMSVGIFTYKIKNDIKFQAS
jgi:hypothetical protein